MIRLNKYIADTGICTRREADRLIANGDIRVDGMQIKKLGSLVSRDAKVSYKGKIIYRKESTYVLLNKPSNPKSSEFYCSQLNGKFSQELVEISSISNQISGLFLFTNDSLLIQKLHNPKCQILNKYKIELSKALTQQQLSSLNVFFYDVQLPENRNEKYFFIHTLNFSSEQQLIDQLNELCVEFSSIDRIEFGPLKKGGLTRGNYRELSVKEIGFLKMVKVSK